jgi:hypothetical protein
MEHYISSAPTFPPRQKSTKTVEPIFVDSSGDSGVAPAPPTTTPSPVVGGATPHLAPVVGGATPHLALNDTWACWAHLPHDTDWSVKSYKLLCELSTVEETCGFIHHVPDGMIQNCMLFVMRKGIDPLWEHPRNRKGGSFSYKVDTDNIAAAWRELVCRLAGETLVRADDVASTINGITISPKRNFCIVKIWLSTCNHQNPRIIDTMKHISPVGCLFKRHAPEY